MSTTAAPAIRRRPSRLRRVLRAVNPQRLLFGPIFLKEVIVSARRRSSSFSRTGYALILVAVASIALYGTWQQAQYGGVAYRLAAYADIAPTVATVVGWLQFILLTLIGAILCAGAFSEERQARTLHSLLATPLNSAQIVFGKLTSRLLQLVILAIVPLPILLILRVYGGLEAENVLAFTVISILSGGFSAAFAMLLSIVNKRPWSVFILSIIFIGLLNLVPSFVLPAMIMGAGGAPTSTLGHVIAWSSYVSPGLALFGLQFRGYPMLYAVPPWIMTAGTLAALTVLISLFSALILRPVMLAERATPSSRRSRQTTSQTHENELTSQAGESAAPRRRRRRGVQLSRIGMVVIITCAASLIALLLYASSSDDTYPWGLVIAMPLIGLGIDVLAPTRKTDASRVIGEHPIWWRELRSTVKSNRHALITMLVVVGGILFSLYTSIEADDDALHGVVILSFTGIHFLAAAVMNTSRFASEREARTWDTLLCTPLSATNIVLSKFLVGVVQLMPVPAMILLHLLIFTAIGAVPIRLTAFIMPLLLSYTLMIAATGIYFGYRARRSVVGSVLNLGFYGCLWIGFPMITAILEEVLDISTSDNIVMQALLFLNAPYLMSESVSGTFTYGGSIAGGTPYNFVRAELGMANYLTLTSASSVAALSIAALAVWLTIRRLRKNAIRRV